MTLFGTRMFGYFHFHGWIFSLSKLDFMPICLGRFLTYFLIPSFSNQSMLSLSRWEHTELTLTTCFSTLGLYTPNYRIDSVQAVTWIVTRACQLSKKRRTMNYRGWFRNPANSPVEVGSLSRYLRGFIHPKWLFRISEPSKETNSGLPFGDV